MKASDVEEEMTYVEFNQWLSYFKWRNEEEKKAHDKAMKKGGRR